MAGRSMMRRAALRLSGLHRDDRRWILSQLPAEQVSTLEELLREVDRLGISDVSVFEEILRESPDPASAKAGDGEEHGQRLAELAHDESDVWLGIALAGRPPERTEAMLDALPDRALALRLRTRAAEASISVPEAVRSAASTTLASLLLETEVAPFAAPDIPHGAPGDVEP